MVKVMGGACQGANGRERLPPESMCVQAHIWIILCPSQTNHHTQVFRKSRISTMDQHKPVSCAGMIVHWRTRIKEAADAYCPKTSESG